MLARDRYVNEHSIGLFIGERWMFLLCMILKAGIVTGRALYVVFWPCVS
jgi:hypothetical protein